MGHWETVRRKLSWLDFGGFFCGFRTRQQKSGSSQQLLTPQDVHQLPHRAVGGPPVGQQLGGGASALRRHTLESPAPHTHR